MALGVADGSLDDRERCDGRRRDLRRPSDHDGDIEVIGEQFAGFDRRLVAAIDQNHTFARHVDERNFGRGLARGGKQCGHLGSCLGPFGGPARGLAQVDEIDPLRALACLVREQRRLLGAADGE